MFSLTNGFLVTNANCSTTGLVVPLKALQDKFGPLSRVLVVTMQAISGAGYPGKQTGESWVILFIFIQYKSISY
jgi:aspartate-semialdehyde dehydrogenase